MELLKRKLGIPCARKFIESGLVEFTGCTSQKKERLSIRGVAIAGRDVLKSAGLQPRSLQAAMRFYLGKIETKKIGLSAWMKVV